MPFEDRAAVMRSILGPPPDDPAKRSNFELGVTAFAELPESVANVVSLWGPGNPELAEVFGSLLPSLVGDIVWIFVKSKMCSSFFDAATLVLSEEPICSAYVFGFPPETRARIVGLLAEDVSQSLWRTIQYVPVYRALFTPPS
jgi:hypothetical protein